MPPLQIGGLTVVPSEFVSDLVSVRRTLMERLFGFPWRPLTSHRWASQRILILFYENTYFCSYATYAALIKELQDPPA